MMIPVKLKTRMHLKQDDLSLMLQCMKVVSQLILSLTLNNTSKLNSYNTNEILFLINKKNNQAKKT